MRVDLRVTRTKSLIVQLASGGGGGQVKLDKMVDEVGIELASLAWL